MRPSGSVMISISPAHISLRDEHHPEISFLGFTGILIRVDGNAGTVEVIQKAKKWPTRR
jgi:hypothetical protein